MIQQLQVKEALPSPGNKVAVTASVLWHLEELCPNPLTSEETIDRRIIIDNQSQFNEFIDRDTHKLEAAVAFSPQRAREGRTKEKKRGDEV